ncbi:MAG: primosomal protein N' [Candidatus Omnitrophica bacterium]|nr:primosomal protein N' [Candidatus Omnitrophota bacterium]
MRYGNKFILLHSVDENSRWAECIKYINETINSGKSVIILFPDINSAQRIKRIIDSSTGLTSVILYRNQPKELEEWLKVKTGGIRIVLGTRSCVFAPVSNLGLIIIEQEQDEAYKQDQVPHYHPREVAIMRADIERANLIFASSCPSLESMYLARKKKCHYIFLLGGKKRPEVKVIDIKGSIFLSKYLQDAIASNLIAKKKTLLFYNRKGFATSAVCKACGKALRCSRCQVNLTYHYENKMLICHYCNFKISVPEICPDCNAGYIRYSGRGTEKVESELARIFPTAKIVRLDRQEPVDTAEADIFIATSSIIRKAKDIFSLVAVISADNMLNRVDFRSAEKTFQILAGLYTLTKDQMVIQTRYPRHHCFQAFLFDNDFNLFYDEELKQRRQLNFPPFRNFALVKVRGEKEEQVKNLSLHIFEYLKKKIKDKIIQVNSVNAGFPSRLRGKYYWQVLSSSKNVNNLSNFLKINLKRFSRSGIIITVDIDPL